MTDATTSSSLPLRNSKREAAPHNRAQETDNLLSSIKALIIPFITAADEDAATKSTGHGLQQQGGGPRTTLLEHHAPQKLSQLLNFALPDEGRGREGLVRSAQDILKYSVNTWDQGFLDKLYASTTPVGLASDLLLSTLNTNVHVYQVSPVLTLVEKETCRALASLFGLTGSYAGGVSQPGGSAANGSSIVIARNHLFPETKTDGLSGTARKLVLFTSQHGHYSVEKAAQMYGFGSRALRPVAVDANGAMRPDALEEAIQTAKAAGETPFYVNATAGTTVLGSFDPLDAIADICKRHGLWLHVDASWGGGVVFSETLRHERLRGIEHADTITWCAHKMLNVPLTCSFLLGRDLRTFHHGMTLPAGYLFHSDDDGDSSESAASTPKHFHDLADLTPQCGRRGDSLKLALSWQYYGTQGFRSQLEYAFTTAAAFSHEISSAPDFDLVTPHPPACLQVCFYYRQQKAGDGDHTDNEAAASFNSRVTTAVSKALIPRGFMVDYAPGEFGTFFRAVVNLQTRPETLTGLLAAIREIGVDTVQGLERE